MALLVQGAWEGITPTEAGALIRDQTDRRALCIAVTSCNLFTCVLFTCALFICVLARHM